MKRITLVIPSILLAGTAYGQPMINSQARETVPATVITLPAMRVKEVPPSNRFNPIYAEGALPTPTAASRLTFYGEQNTDGSWTLHMGTQTMTAAGFDDIPEKLIAMHREALAEEQKK